MCFLILISLSALSFLYFLLLQLSSPGTLAGTFLGFSAVWLYLAVFLALLAVLEKKKGIKKVWLGLRKRTRTVVCLVLALGAAVSALNLAFILNPEVSDGSENVKYVILLGGGVTKDARLTESVQMRVEKAAEYLKAHPDALAVVTGGKGSFAPCPEADVLKPALASLGVDESRILAEDKALDTIQNFMYSARLLAEHDGVEVSDVLSSPVAVVTSRFHLARAERIARRMGFKEVYGAGSKVPSLFVLNTYCREILAYVKLNLRILLTGKPGTIAEVL